MLRIGPYMVLEGTGPWQCQSELGEGRSMAQALMSPVSGRSSSHQPTISEHALRFSSDLASGSPTFSALCFWKPLAIFPRVVLQG